MKKYKEFIKAIIFVMGIQGISYFLIKKIATNYHLITSIINIPFIKESIYIYNTWYPFIFLSVLIVYKHNKDLFRSLVFTMFIAGLISHITFLVYPTLLIRPTIDVKTFTDLVVDVTYKVDSPAINCLPSMHCIFCFVTSFFIWRCKEIKPIKRYGYIIFSFLIVVSTLLTKQHIIEDVLLAAVYSAACIAAVMLYKDKINNLVKKVFG